METFGHPQELNKKLKISRSHGQANNFGGVSFLMVAGARFLKLFLRLGQFKVTTFAQLDFPDVGGNGEDIARLSPPTAGKRETVPKREIYAPSR
jgi:hypothetical protein